MLFVLADQHEADPRRRKPRVDTAHHWHTRLKVLSHETRLLRPPTKAFRSVTLALLIVHRPTTRMTDRVHETTVGRHSPATRVVRNRPMVVFGIRVIDV